MSVACGGKRGDVTGGLGKGPGNNLYHFCMPPVAQPNCPEPMLFSKVVTGHRRESTVLLEGFVAGAIGFRFTLDTAVIYSTG